ncbi:N-acetyltransferase [Nocardia panacis]|uniref:N-acetyltransferase n=1 Tax=Nocardia panacis TaxID=2340916 RepID=A0A3A4K6V9_9NOCA|nr:GNAT family N-acetyltransferase [Nocardia panacis]RJO76839.1 N-acetyltransferase [Nocardia panacis]
MPTEIRDNIALERFEIHVDGTLVGYTDYQDTAAERAFVHTEIHGAGTGYGHELIESALNATGVEGLGVLPMCPLVQQFVEQRPEYLTMVPHWARDQLGLSQ